MHEASKSLNNRAEHALTTSTKPGTIVSQFEHSRHNHHTICVPAYSALLGILARGSPVKFKSVGLTKKPDSSLDRMIDELRKVTVPVFVRVLNV